MGLGLGKSHRWCRLGSEKLRTGAGSGSAQAAAGLWDGVGTLQGCRHSREQVQSFCLLLESEQLRPARGGVVALLQFLHAVPSSWT